LILLEYFSLFLYPQKQFSKLYIPFTSFTFFFNNNISYYSAVGSFFGGCCDHLCNMPQEIINIICPEPYLKHQQKGKLIRSSKCDGINAKDNQRRKINLIKIPGKKTKQ